MKIANSLCKIPLLVLTAAYLLMPCAAAEKSGSSKRGKSGGEDEGIVIKREIKMSEVPYLSTYYIQPIVSHKEKIRISFYVTDWWQSEYRLLDFSHRFDVTLTYGKDENPDEHVKVMKGIKGGDHTFEIDPLPTGTYYLALHVVDQHGRHGRSLFHEFRVLNLEKFAITEEQTYRMKESDLKKFDIHNKDTAGSIHFFDATGKDWKTTQKMAEELAKTMKPESKKYLVIAGGEKYDPEKNKNHRGANKAPQPEWLPNSWGWKSCKVLFAPDYNFEAVENRAIRNGDRLNMLIRAAVRKNYRKLVLLPGVYRISNTTPIIVPKNFTLDLNGATIKMNRFAGSGATIMEIQDGYDSHIVNGIVEGDYFEHDYENSPNNSEWVCGIGMKGDCRYSSYERVLVRYITGYGVSHGFSGQFTQARKFPGINKGTVDLKTGEYLPEKENFYVTDPLDIVDFSYNGGYMTASKLLGYQGIGADEWNLMYHFYDADNKYLETIHGAQYRRVRIPTGAQYARVTSWGPPIIFSANMFRMPWNSWYEDVFILSARCVGMAPGAMYNFRIANCSFVRSGENLATCAFDAEDGWDMVQDTWMYRNKFFKNPLNELLTCSGHNFIFEDNEGKIYLWERTNAYVIRNNEFYSGFFGSGGRTRSLYPRITNNTFIKSVQFCRPPKIKTKGQGGADDGGSKVDVAALLAPGDVENRNAAEVSDGIDPNDADAEREKAEKEEKERKEKDFLLDTWFVAMHDVDSSRIKTIGCGVNGLLVKAKLDGGKYRALNLLKSSVKNSEVQFAGSKMYYSTLEKVTGRVYGDLLMVGCNVKELSSGLGSESSVVIRDCKIKNLTFSYSYWTNPGKVKFINCTIDNDDKTLLRIPSYSVGDIQFIDCKIDTGKAPLMEVYDMRPSPGDAIDGTVTFQNCDVRTRASRVVKLPETLQETKKNVTFKSEGSTFNTALIGEMPPAWIISAKDKNGRYVRSSSLQKQERSSSKDRKSRRNKRR